MFSEFACYHPPAENTPRVRRRSTIDAKTDGSKAERLAAAKAAEAAAKEAKKEAKAKAERLAAEAAAKAKKGERLAAAAAKAERLAAEAAATDDSKTDGSKTIEITVTKPLNMLLVMENDRDLDERLAPAGARRRVVAFDVEVNGNSYRAGIRQKDAIVKVNHTDVRHLDDFAIANMINENQAPTVKLSIERFSTLAQHDARSAKRVDHIQTMITRARARARSKSSSSSTDWED